VDIDPQAACDSTVATPGSPSERYLRELYRSGPLFTISQGTLPWQPIFGKIGEMTFIQHAGVSKWIRISQFQFTDVK